MRGRKYWRGLLVADDCRRDNPVMVAVVHAVVLAPLLVAAVWVWRYYA